MYVKERFSLNQYTKDLLQDLEPNFGYGGFGEFIFYRTYSRIKKDGGQENWADVVTRVTEGTFSIRKDHYLKNYISWDEKYWQDYANKFAFSMFRMEWLPPGRGLWMAGTDFIYERGSMALYNCSALEITDDLPDCYSWLMDSLMMGVGVGFSPTRNDSLTFKINNAVYPKEFVIKDTRESWCESVASQLNALQTGTPLPRFIYDEIRPKGQFIKGFGGIASGPEPLVDLHCIIPELVEKYNTDTDYDSVILKTDIANLIGKTVVSGNVRRSAELASLSINDPVFKEIKNYKKYPEREQWGWLSNNSVDLEKDEDFEKLGEIAELIKNNGEPGFKNLQNFKYGRIGRPIPVRNDDAKFCNPCAEIPLFDREVCNISETFPTVCNDALLWLEACNYATTYCSTVSLLPTHQPSTNRIVARNRRIGVGFVDFTGWVHDASLNKVIKWMRRGYDKVTQINQQLNAEAGVPEALRKTCLKPGGSVPKLAGKTSGAGYPTFRETLRRVRVSKTSSICPLLIEANIPYEEDKFDRFTWVFEWPILQGPAKAAYEITLWQQAMNLIVLQKEWSDNAISNTLYFKPKWVLSKVYDNIENLIANALDDLKDILSHDNYTTMSMQFHDDEKEEIVLDKHKLVIKYNEDSDDKEIMSIKLFVFDPKHEEDDIEPVLSAIAPLIKTASLLPHSSVGAYSQMPESGLTVEEYNKRKASIKAIDWSKLSGSDGTDEKYCQGDACEIVQQS